MKTTTLVKQLKKSINQPKFWQGTALALFAVIILTQIFDIKITPRSSFLKQLSPKKTDTAQTDTANIDTAALTAAVLPEEGVVLPIVWKDLGKKMISDGVIDEQKFRALFDGGLTNIEEQMLSGTMNEPIVMNQTNSRFILDALWAFGLANKNEILEKGEMTDKQYGGDASKFASTGGWSISRGAGFDHYSKHVYVILTPPQQALVDTVSRGIFRPCCGNSTHFPDCNHGMAMLGLLELMAANGVSEQEMYQTALQVNAFWFPQTYIDLATYFKEQGKDWNQVDPKEVLGSQYSSAQGYQQTRQNIKSLPKSQSGGGGCGA